MSMRTTLYLPDTLHQRLQLVAQREDTSLSRLVSEILEKSLAKIEQRRTQHTHAVLQELKGIGGKGTPDASTTIDHLLYTLKRKKGQT